MRKIIQQGAEAVISLDRNRIIKNRIKKSYRLPLLDEKLRKSRTKKEAKLLEKVSKLIKVPKVINTDKKQKITMQFIEGKKLSEHLDSLKNSKKVCKEIGKQIAKLHDADIIHGDLTTSNMIYVEDNNQTNAKNNKFSLINKKINSISSEASKSSKKERFRVYFIDFGLGFHSRRIEDKAVDLHLLRQALEAKHFQAWREFFSSVLEGYSAKDKEKILQQLKKVESRGRYKH